MAYDLGAASPLGIASAARGLCRIVFLADRSRPHVADQYDAMCEWADVVDITGLDEDEVYHKVSGIGAAGVVTFSEFQQRLVAHLAHRAGWRGHGTQTAALLTDKHLQRRCLSDAGVESTRSALIAAESDIEKAAVEVGFPAVFKPRHGAASAHTRLVESVEECRSAFADSPASEGLPFVLEEFLVGDPRAAGAGWGDFVAVSSVVQDGVVQTACVTGKHPLAEPFRETGDVIPHTLDDSLAEDVVRLERAALTALGVREGVCETEIKLTAAGPRIIEVNGRLAGYLHGLLRLATGANMIRTVLQVALGEPVTVSPPAVDGVAYQRFIAPPFGSREVVSLSPLEELENLPGVEWVDVRAEVGQRVTWQEGTQSMLAIVHGSARSHAEVLSLIGHFEDAAKECCA
ncbi:acetyl-CoA carboxylase biotin carboxylase subunit family protein [Micromonospora sp. NPDC048930]|uniref:ATP-grasp domain-containing protein n=1 Tax=Micromonospora sp. NPDC048930 TaxID=3364261 RepID=UPI00371396E7